MDIRMILIQPMSLLPRQQALVDQTPAVRHHRHVLKAQIRLLAERVLRLRFLHHDDVLDADPEGAVLVVARLVGDHVTDCEGDFRVLDAGADADGAFVDVEVGADAVAGAVAVVKAFFLWGRLVFLIRNLQSGVRTTYP
jgi:hypothetical protein